MSCVLRICLLHPPSADRGVPLKARYAPRTTHTHSGSSEKWWPTGVTPHALRIRLTAASSMSLAAEYSGNKKFGLEASADTCKSGSTDTYNQASVKEWFSVGAPLDGSDWDNTNAIWESSVPVSYKLKPVCELLGSYKPHPGLDLSSDELAQGFDSCSSALGAYCEDQSAGLSNYCTGNDDEAEPQCIYVAGGGWDLDCNGNGLPNDYNCYGIDGCYCGSNGQCQAVEQCKTHSNTRCSARDNNPDGGELVSYDEKLTMDECKDLCLERARQRGATADFCCDFGLDGSGHTNKSAPFGIRAPGTEAGTTSTLQSACSRRHPPRQTQPQDTTPGNGRAAETRTCCVQATTIPAQHVCTILRPMVNAKQTASTMPSSTSTPNRFVASVQEQWHLSKNSADKVLHLRMATSRNRRKTWVTWIFHPQP